MKFVWGEGWVGVHTYAQMFTVVLMSVFYL